MATSTQYNPNQELNARLLATGASKTVYALVTPETESVKAAVFGDFETEQRYAFLDQFREAWTGKQDQYHEEFFSTWCEWSKPVVELDRANFPFFYPTAGASEPLRHLIFDHAAKGGKTIHVFEGEYEGYKAMAEAAGLEVIECRRTDWRGPTIAQNPLCWLARALSRGDSLFFISQPSAIDGNVWPEFNEFVSKMPKNSVVADLTYVGAVADGFKFIERFDMNQPAIRNVVFSLSKPFGAYYDRIGGVFCREEDMGLFGNKWFKSLSALAIGTALMQKYDVFYMWNTYQHLQLAQTKIVSNTLGLDLTPCDIFILAAGEAATPEEWEDVGAYLQRPEMVKYLQRGRKTRVCLTPGMAKKIGTAR